VGGQGLTPVTKSSGGKGDGSRDDDRDVREPRWAAEPTADDVTDATWYLTLLGVTGPLAVDSEQRDYPAKDLLRASRLPLLPRDNAGVRKWRARLRDGDEIPPVLLRVGSLGAARPLVLAEGYHRVCACYLEAEDTPVACHLLVGPALR
jgi:hypothetical protein